MNKLLKTPGSRRDKRSIIYQTAILSASNIFLQLLGFAYRILLSRLAGPEGMGVYTLVMQVYSMVVSICLSGVSIAVTTLSAKLYARGNMLGLQRLVRYAMGLFFGLFLLAAVPVTFFHHQIAEDLLGDGRTANALLMVLICIFLTGYENIFKAVFHGSKRVQFSAVSEVTEQTARIFLVLFLLKRFMNQDSGYTAFLILSGMTLSEVFSVSILGFSYLKCFARKRGSADSPVPGINGQFLKIALPSAANAAVCTLFGSVSTVLFPTRLIAAGFLRTDAVSILGVISGMAGPLIRLPFALIGSLCTVLMPAVSACAAARDKKGVCRKIVKGFQATAWIGLPATAVLLVLLPDLCGLLFKQRVSESLAAFLAVETALSYFCIICINMLVGLSQQKRVLIYTVIGEGVQLILMWFLTALPQWNIYGYLTAAIVGAAVRLILCLRRVRLLTGTGPRLLADVAAPLIASALLFALTSLAAPRFTVMTGSVGWGAALSVALAVPVYAALTRTMGARSFRDLWR